MRKLMFVLSAALLLIAAAPRKDWKDVEEALGRAGSVQPGDVYKVSFPRGDLDRRRRRRHGEAGARPRLVGGVQRDGQQSRDGDGRPRAARIEVTPVIDALQKGGIEQSALHNHLHRRVAARDVPALQRPRRRRKARADASRRARADQDADGTAAAPPASPTIDLADRGPRRASSAYAGKLAGGTYQFGVPRAEKIMEHGVEVPPSMGIGDRAQLPADRQRTRGDHGRLRAIGSEVNPVIRALRASGIAVTALHSHMLDESPRLFFMHFWANDDANTLATTLRNALDRMHTKPASPATRSDPR